MAQSVTADSVREFLHTLSMIPGLGDIVRQFLNSVLGTAPYGLSWTGIDPSKSLPWNVASAERSRFIQGALQQATLNSIQQQTVNALTNTYRLLGYDPGRAAAEASAASKGFLGSIVGMAFAPQLQAASSRFGLAAYRRMTAHGVAGYGRIIGNLWEDTLNAAASGNLAGLSQTDAAAILSEMVGNGALESGGMSKASMTTRVRKIKEELVSYAHSVGVLKDIIDGPVEEILRQFEGLTGNRLTSMAPGRAAVLAGAMRNVVYNTGASYQQIGLYTAMQFGLINPYGGNMAQANALALSALGAVKSGYRIENLSDEQLSSALVRDNARKFISGELRRQAAVYVHWRQSNNFEDNIYTKEAFRQSGINVDAYIRQNNINSSFFASQAVTNAITDPVVVASLRANQFDKYQNRLRSLDIRGLTGKANAARIRDIISTEYDPARMQEKLIAEGLTPNQAAELARRVGAVARSSFNTSNVLEAFGMAATAENGLAVQRRELGNYALQQLRGQRMTAGVGGIFDLLAKDPNSKIGVAALLTSWLSGDPREARKTEGVVRQLLEKGDRAGLEKLFEGTLGAENVKAILGDWGKSAAFVEAAQTMSALDAKGKPKLSRKELIARRRAILNAVRMGNNNPELTLSYIQELAEGTTLDERTQVSLFLGGRLGTDSADAATVDRYMQFNKESKEYILSQSGKTLGQLSKEEKRKLDADASELALARVQGRTLADTLRWSTSGRRSVEDTMKFIKDHRDDKNVKAIWEKAAAAHRAATGKEFIDNEEAEKFIRSQFVERGGIEELLTTIIAKIDQWIKALDNASGGNNSRGG